MHNFLALLPPLPLLLLFSFTLFPPLTAFDSAALRACGNVKSNKTFDQYYGCRLACIFNRRLYTVAHLNEGSPCPEDLTGVSVCVCVLI